MVCNLALGYAGTGDLIGKVDGKRWLVDIKTSQEGKGPYPETGLQLAGYAKAEFFGRPGDPVKHRLPPCTRFGVLHLSPAGYRLVEYRVDRETWRRLPRRAHDHRAQGEQEGWQRVPHLAFQDAGGRGPLGHVEPQRRPALEDGAL